jgi:hypothetical protein
LPLYLLLLFSANFLHLGEPIPYLSKTFKYSLSFVDAMADEGCVMSGSRTQEFLLPGSIGEGSDWDIYVPGNVKSVTNMLSVLSACGNRGARSDQGFAFLRKSHTYGHPNLSEQ